MSVAKNACKRRSRIRPSVRQELDQGRFVLRGLDKGDFDKGYLELLGQLTTVGPVSKADFQRRLQDIAELDDYYIYIIEDTDAARVVGAATLIIERKLIHACGLAGHIEDVVVDGRHRGHQLGKTLIQALTALARREGCYKVILDCSLANVPFYEKCGLTQKHVQMVRPHPIADFALYLKISQEVQSVAT